MARASRMDSRTTSLMAAARIGDFIHTLASPTVVDSPTINGRTRGPTIGILANSTRSNTPTTPSETTTGKAMTKLTMPTATESTPVRARMRARATNPTALIGLIRKLIDEVTPRPGCLSRYSSRRAPGMRAKTWRLDPTAEYQWRSRCSEMRNAALGMKRADHSSTSV